MPEKYEIFADEAWTHNNPPPNRYWCFYGGIFGKSSDLDRLDTSLRDIVQVFGIKSEIKWTNLSAHNIDCYKALIDELMIHLRESELHYRQMFLDRSYVWVNQHEEGDLTELDVQFKLYYQFIKHAFGIRYLPRKNGGTEILLRLDNHSSQGHKDRLTKFCEDLPGYLGRPDITIRVTFVNSKKVLRLQICDLLMGAAGSYGNKMHLKRLPGKRGMTEKQKLRLDLCKYIYNSLKSLDHDERGSMAFNWFETTGHDGDLTFRWRHKLRIWKFVPRHHRRDIGWQNDHLDAKGNYVGPQLV